LTHPWRLGEALIGAAALLLFALFGVGWPLLAASGYTPPAVAVPDAVEYGLVLITPVEWLLLLGGLGATRVGREYLQSTASEDLAQRNVESQPNNLTVAGLVLAALAISPAAVVHGGTGALLVASLAGFLFAWAVGNAPYRKSGMIVADAMHWSGLALLIGAVALVAGVDAIPAGVAIASVATTLIAVYSGSLALAYWRSGHQG